MSNTIREYVINSEEDQHIQVNNCNEYYDLCIIKIKKDDFPEVISFIWVILWLLLIPILFYWINDKTIEFIKDISLNNIGDYLAGVAAPIAFLWLVLGYKQQSKELSINNEMLRLQHEELKNSVTAQVDQAASMKQQIDILIRDKYYPKFKLESFEFYRAEDFIEITLKNITNEVDGINIAIISNEMILTNMYHSNDITYISLQTLEEIGNDLEIRIEIEFNIETGNKIKQCFLLHYNEFRHTGKIPDFNKIICEESK